MKKKVVFIILKSQLYINSWSVAFDYYKKFHYPDSRYTRLQAEKFGVKAQSG
jgi:hypothetical protein